MPGSFATARDFIARLGGGLRGLAHEAPSVTDAVREGRKAAFTGESSHSLVGGGARWLADKIKGKPKVDEWLYRNFQRPLKNIDENVGASLAKHLNAPKLFKHVDVLPHSSTIEGNRALMEHTTHSATAPIGKVVKATAPLAASLYAMKLMSGGDEEKTAMAQEDKNELLKESSVALTTAHRRIEAEKLAFVMVEQGKIPPFGDFDSFQEKVAFIMDKNLEAVEQALEMDANLADMGKVAAEASPVVGADSAVTAFYHRLAGE